MIPLQTVMVRPTPSVTGRVRPPGDKSVSHRYALLAAIADGVSTIAGYSTGADCASTLRCLRGLGVAVEERLDDPVDEDPRQSEQDDRDGAQEHGAFHRPS